MPEPRRPNQLSDYAVRTLQALADAGLGNKISLGGVLNLPTLADRVDFLVRLCGAWDFGILPDWETVEEIRRPEWKEAVEETNLLTSPVYHLLRSWHHLPERPYLGQRLAYIDEDPELQHV